LLRQHLRGIVPLLHLHPDAEGLAVFSQDRRILRKLSEDAAILEQELVVEVAGSAAPSTGARGARPGVRRPAAAALQGQLAERAPAAVRDEGHRPALVPWMCAQIGLQVRSLRRIRLGRVPMAGLPAGQWRWLQPHERF
jgi:23S rRNA pseudouridine2604 synthase